VEQRHHQSYEDFINARNEIALDIGYARECTYHVVSWFMIKHINIKKKCELYCNNILNVYIFINNHKFWNCILTLEYGIL